MSRLVVVSNRVAVPGENRAGGLAVGLLAALKERGAVVRLERQDRKGRQRHAAPAEGR